MIRADAAAGGWASRILPARALAAKLRFLYDLGLLESAAPDWTTGSRLVETDSGLVVSEARAWTMHALSQVIEERLHIHATPTFLATSSFYRFQCRILEARRRWSGVRSHTGIALLEAAAARERRIRLRCVGLAPAVGSGELLVRLRLAVPAVGTDRASVRRVLPLVLRDPRAVVAGRAIEGWAFAPRRLAGTLGSGGVRQPLTLRLPAAAAAVGPVPPVLVAIALVVAEGAVPEDERPPPGPLSAASLARLCARLRVLPWPDSWRAAAAVTRDLCARRRA